MRRRTFLTAAAAAALPLPAIGQGAAKTLRIAPETNLASIDPIWTTATVSQVHGCMVYDTLFGGDEHLNISPQMAEGHTLSDDKRTWTVKLREGLAFHDGEKVRAADCIASISRWSKRAAWGQALGAVMDEMKAIDDRSFTIHTKKPFPHMLTALGVGGCFIMPERVAQTDPFKQVTDPTGSGPFIFKADEYVAGARAVWVKNAKYVSRNEKPAMFAGGKPVYVDRVEQTVMPDGATAAAALQNNEIDWIHVPVLDLLPMLAKSQGVRVFINDPFGWIGIIRPNFLYPPFNNHKLLRAIMPAIDQQEFLDAVIGDQHNLGKVPVGFFPIGGPMSSTVGMEALSGKRDVGLAKRLVAESGYKGEKVVLMAPSDQPSLMQMTQVVRDVFIRVGLNVDYQVMDWSTLVARRASREPPEKGGWNAFCTAWGGLNLIDPGGHYPIRGNGKAAWFGWPDDPKMEQMRDSWLDAPDKASQKKICEDIQGYAFQQLPMIPVGQWFYPFAARTRLTDFVRGPYALHWNIKKA